MAQITIGLSPDTLEELKRVARLEGLAPGGFGALVDHSHAAGEDAGLGAGADRDARRQARRGGA